MGFMHALQCLRLSPAKDNGKEKITAKWLREGWSRQREGRTATPGAAAALTVLVFVSRKGWRSLRGVTVGMGRLEHSVIQPESGPVQLIQPSCQSQ